MSDPLKITREVQKLEPDALIALWILDLSGLGGSTYYFHGERSTGGANLTFNGQAFVAIPITAEGFAFNGTEQNPTPTLILSNVGTIVPALIRDYEDLVGAKVTRIRTFRKHLADGSDPDGAAQFSADVFFVNRRTSDNKIAVQFELGASTDVEGITLPLRRAVANLCPWVFKGTECGYSGAGTTCAKTLAACKTYHGATAALPFGGFPGLSRVSLQ
jgi:lambda family phage minor tail protein L